MAVPPEVSLITGNTPSEAAAWDECTLTHFGHSSSVGFLASPVVFEGVGGSAGSSANAVGVVTRVANSSYNMAGVVLRVADTSSDVEGVTVKTAGLSTGSGSMGLGWVASSTSAPDNPCARPSKTSQSLKVMYLHICCLNLCMHIAKWWGSLGTGGLAFSAHY